MNPLPLPQETVSILVSLFPLFLLVLFSSSTVDCDSLQHHPPPHHLVKRLVGGEQVLTIEDAPFVVQLVRNNKTICSGSIIAPDLVLTCAHCTLKSVDFIAYGTTRLYSARAAAAKTNTFKVMKIRKIIAHPQYQRVDSSKWSNDIAILRLRRPILPDRVAQAIALPTSRFETIECGSKVTVYGFGKVADRHEAAKDWRKREAKKSLQVMETAIQDSCWTDSRAKFIATQRENRTVCAGDSGGSLVSADYRLIGVTARSSCVRGKRDLFVSVASHLDFIRKEMPNSRSKSKKYKKLLKNL